MNWVVLGFVVFGVFALLLIIGVVAYTKCESFIQTDPYWESPEVGAYRYQG
jgi:hypothetical protein